MTWFYQLLRVSNHWSWLKRILSPWQSRLMAAKSIFNGICPLNLHFLWNFPKSGVKNAIFIEKFHNIRLLAIISHGCKGKNIIHNHDPWLRRIFFPSQLWLTVANRLISWDFSIKFMKMSWLLKTCILYEFGKKEPIYFLNLQSRFPES